MEITLEEVGEYLENFHKYSGYAMANCCFHNDSNPSMQVTEKGYYCKSCQAKGSLIGLYNKVSKSPKVIKQKVYNPSAWIWKNWEKQFGSIKVICELAYKNMQFNPNTSNYLNSRGLDTVAIKKGRLGYLDGYYIFPIKDENGEVQGAIARASPTIETKNNRYSVTHGCPIKLYSPDWDRINKSEDIYVCFGTIDVWSLWLAGYPSLTGISGQELNAVNLNRFRKRIYVIADKGEEKSALRLQSQLGWRGFPLLLDWKENTKDLNSIHTNYGLDEMKNLIENAKRRFEYDQVEFVK